MAKREKILVRNFPDDYPFRKKLLANLFHLIGNMPIRIRETYLQDEDPQMFRKIIQKGDIVLVGQSKRLSSVFIGGPLNHALIYTGKGKLIHSIKEGVQSVGFEEFFMRYDTLLILRLKNIEQEKINKMIEFARNHLGTPFNFEFKEDGSEKFYCSELIYRAMEFAGIEVQICNPEGNPGIGKTILRKTPPIHPMSYLTDSFKVVAVSTNLKAESLGLN